SAPDLTPEPQSTAATTKSEAVPESAGKGGPPRFWIPDKALDQALTPHEFTVYAVLCRTAGKSRRCWPSITTIVRHGPMKRRAAVAARGALETRGMIECRKRFQKTSVYTLTTPDHWHAVVPKEALLGVPEAALLEGLQ